MRPLPCTGVYDNSQCGPEWKHLLSTASFTVLSQSNRCALTQRLVQLLLLYVCVCVCKPTCQCVYTLVFVHRSGGFMRLHTLKKKKSTINKLKKTNLFFLDLMLIELPDEHILGYCPGPRGRLRLSFGPHWDGLRNLSALGEAFKRPGGILQPGLASHSGSGHLGRCPNLPLEVWTELGFSACFVSPES